MGLWLTVLPGYGLYAMAPERLRCERSAGGETSAEQQAIVDGVTAFLADASATTFEATTGGGPPLRRIPLWLLFVVGALCLINIPFATAKAIRERPARGSARHSG